MSELEKKLALNARRFLRITFGYNDKFETTSDNCDFFNQSASDLIRAGLESKIPFAVSRFGYSELRTLLTYLHIQEKGSKFTKLFSFIKGDKVEPWWCENTTKIITHNAGLFPKQIDIIEKFCQMSLRDMQEIDVLGSWLGGESWIKPVMPNTKFMRFHDFYHFLHADPWTTGLKDKRVLVVHPFAKSIESQYKL